MRVFITGGSGFLGYNLLKSLLSEGHEVYALSRKSYPVFAAIQNSAFHMLFGSLQSLRDLDCPDFDLCLHFAWSGMTRGGVADSSVQEENFQMGLDVFDFCCQHHCKALVMAGTRQEYALTNDWITETSICNPVSEYGKSKYALFRQLRSLCMQEGLQYVHLRIFSVYGNGDHPWSLVSSLVRNMLEGKDMELGQCLHEWSFLYIDDFVSAVCKIIASLSVLPPMEVFNVGSRHVYPLKYFVEAVRDVISENVAVESRLMYGAFKENPESIYSLKPVVEKVENAVGWREMVDFREGIRRIVSIQAGAVDFK